MRSVRRQAVWGLAPIVGLASLAMVQLDTKPIQVSQNYRGPEGTVELEGVCRVTTETVACWKADGKPNKVLRDDVLSFLRRNSAITVTYGKKTRYAFFRTRHNPQTRTSRGRLSGSFQGQGWDLTDRSIQGVNASTLVGVRLVSDPDSKTGSAQTQISRYAGPSEPFKLEAGTKLSYLGGTLTILRVAKNQLDPAVYGPEASTRWIIHLSFEGEPSSSVSWVPYDGDGISITAVDGDGKPAIVDPQLLNQLENKWGIGTASVKPNIFRARISDSSSGYVPSLHLGENMVVTNIDPSLIKHVVLHASANQPLTITDVPLDPK